MRITLLLGLLFALPACDTAGPDSGQITIDGADPIDLDTLSQNADALVGEWEWTQSVNYFTFTGEPVLETPDSSGRTQRWVFRADGRALFYENGELVRDVAYEVSRRTYGNGTADARPSLRIDGGYGYDFGTQGDLLVLDSTPVDGPQERYTRK